MVIRHTAWGWGWLGWVGWGNNVLALAYPLAVTSYTFSSCYVRRSSLELPSLLLVTSVTLYELLNAMSQELLVNLLQLHPTLNKLLDATSQELL